ncbi:MAG: peptidoglycan DD-metalloendopeptidase family protein [Rhodoferax sp.]|uniref:peptidoglycan DD-metalloendopeptidase family protein n=1 Tax=Rhodoferax sp. TaxID=50421 RepID=UPI0026394761|nr:peptidoglycan DD-metalloendopeptidase family protein [Rhodoferax sp.]MDD2880658.1 peptidoglycan DD-metalloendopeptidase family protein [Rhodoferax sp.]
MNRLNQWLGLCLVAAMLMLAGCSSNSLNRAPVEDRARTSTNGTGAVGADVAPVKQPQGFENAGRPGYYTVKPGDTLRRIAIENGQNPQDIARWSNVENPNRIEVGQVLRVVPPVESGVVVKPVSKPVVTETVAGPAAVAASTPASAAKPVAAEGDIDWIWPANGAVLAGFDDVKNKGLDIGGAAGDPVLAAADGRVVYVGAGLRGYGNLIILKHDNVFLTAYAHNRALLVKEDQAVLKGQKIAEMGSSDADRVKLHFEVRRQGKPVDPAKYLPVR